MGIPYEKLVEEDLNLGSGAVDVTMPAGGTATGHKIGLHSFGFWLNAQDFIDAAGGNDTVGIQAAFTASQAANGVPIWFPARTTPYVITATLTWLTAVDLVAGPILMGAGRFATVFDNRVANGPMIRIDQTVALKFFHGGHLSGFTIRTTTSPAASDGIYVSAAYQLAFEDIRITGLTGTAINIDVQLGDSDGPVQLTFDRVWLEHCAGYGLNVTQASAASENSLLSMRACFFQYNTLGGARLRALGLTMLDCAFVRNSPASQGVGGCQVYTTASGGSRLLKFLGCTFEGNGVTHLDLQSGSVIQVMNGEFLHNLADVVTNPITTGIKVGGSGQPGGGCANVEIVGSFVRNYTAGYTQVAIGADSVLVSVRSTRWDVFDAATGTVSTDSGVSQTRFTNLGFLSRIEDDGYDRVVPRSFKVTTLTAGQSYTPDANLYTVHRVVLSQVGAYTINAPTTVGAATGKILAFDLTNTSGGAVTVTWNAAFRMDNFTNPGIGEQRTVWFYNDAVAPWMMIGGWNDVPYIIQSGAGTAKSDTFSVWDSTNAIARLFVAGAQVGIGTATPGTALDVQQAAAGGSTLGRVYNPSATIGASAGLWLGTDASAQHCDLRAFGALHATKPNVIELTNFIAADIRFNIAGSPLVYIKSTGRLGIAKAAPGTALAVVGLPTFADNAAALAGALTAGDFYRTATGVVMVVF